MINVNKAPRLRLLKGTRKLIFDTQPVKKGNVIFIIGEDFETALNYIKSTNFRDMDIKDYWVPRYIKVIGKTIKVDRKDRLEKIKAVNSGIRPIKTNLGLYRSRDNIIVDLTLYKEYIDLYLGNRTDKQKLLLYMNTYLKQAFESAYNTLKELGYEKFYAVNMFNSNDDPSSMYLLNRFRMLNVFIAGYNKNIGSMDLNYITDKDDVISIFTNPLNGNYFILGDTPGMSGYDEEQKESILFQKLKLLSRKILSDSVEAPEDITTEEEQAEEVEIQKLEKVNEKKAKIRENILNRFGIDHAQPDKTDEGLINYLDTYLENIIDKTLASGEKIKITDIQKMLLDKPNIKKRFITNRERKSREKRLSIRREENLVNQEQLVDSFLNYNNPSRSLDSQGFEHVADHVPDMFKQAKLVAINKSYQEKQSKRDMIEAVKAFSTDSEMPLIVERMAMRNMDDNFTKKNELKIAFRDVNNVSTTVNVDVPRLIQDNYFYINGNKKSIVKQIMRLPIVKVSPSAVEITGNYVKATVTRVGDSNTNQSKKIQGLISELLKNPKPGIEIRKGNSKVGNARYLNNLLYEILGSSIYIIRKGDFKFIFNRIENEELWKNYDEDKVIELIENKNITPVGVYKNKMMIVDDEAKIGELYYVDPDGSKVKIHSDFFTFIFEKVLEGNIKQFSNVGRFANTRVTISGKKLPLIVLLGLLHPLEDILKRYEVDFWFSTTEKTPSIDIIEIPLMDGYLYYKDTPEASLLLSQLLYAIDTEMYTWEEMNGEVPYSDWIGGRYESTATVASIKSTATLMLDPITLDILKDQQLPTDIMGVFLYANSLLSRAAYKQENDMTNFRIRGAEIVQASLYNVLAKAYDKYKRSNAARSGKKFNIPRDALMKSLLASPNINDYSSVNPILETIDGMSTTSFKGLMGINKDDAVKPALRGFHRSMAGLFANFTPDSSKAGISRSMVYNPQIETVRGYIKETDFKDLDYSNIANPAEAMSSFSSTQSDPSRQGMQVGQMKHMMSVNDTQPALVNCGIDRSLPYLISDEFAFKAKEDGSVLEVDHVTDLIILGYASGKRDVINIKEDTVKNSNGGFHFINKLENTLVVGQKFKKNEVLAYNASFFTNDENGSIYNSGTLAKIAVISSDYTFEDAGMIAGTLSKRMSSTIVQSKSVEVDETTDIVSYVQAGDQIKAGDPLMSLIQLGTSDPDMIAYIQQLRDEGEEIEPDVIKSKYTGTIVDVKMYYNRPIDTFTSSVQQMVSEYTDKIKTRSDKINSMGPTDIIVEPVGQLDRDAKIKGKKIEGLMVEFFIKYVDELTVGDKIVFDSPLKTVISKLLKEDESPYSEYAPDEPIEAVISPLSILNRMTADFYSKIYTNKVLVNLKRKFKDIYEG